MSIDDPLTGRRYAVQPRRDHNADRGARSATTVALRCYGDEIIRVVTGAHPAIHYTAADTAALERICGRLVDACRAAEILQAKGYGKPGLRLHEVAALVPARR